MWLQWRRKELLGRLETALAEHLHTVQQAHPRHKIALPTFAQVTLSWH